MEALIPPIVPRYNELTEASGDGSTRRKAKDHVQTEQAGQLELQLQHCTLCCACAFTANLRPISQSKKRGVKAAAGLCMEAVLLPNRTLTSIW
jgi:hypothetical protein